MAEEEKKEEAKAAEAEDKKDEKKDDKKEKKGNWFSKTWGKMKKSVADSNREGSLEKKYKENARQFSIYTGGFSSLTKWGKLDEEKLTAEIYGTLKDDKEIPFSSILVLEPKDKDKELPKFFYITGAKHEDSDKVSLTIKEKVDDKEVENTYERPLTILSLNKDVKEVNVIKVHDKYFLKLDEKK